MRILCAIGIRRGGELVRRVSRITRTGDELVIVHVLETGPRHDLNHLEGTIRPHHDHRRELDAAEQEAGGAALKEAGEEAGLAGIPATTRLERGRPEQVIVALARELSADLVALMAREMPHGHPLQGPPSIGHTARFVFDHAPSDVLVFREKSEPPWG
ncbi:MAG: universal stress protein [Spirochaetia bacterium]|jgi:nucleotide-binding universal stress UspA family protein